MEKKVLESNSVQSVYTLLTKLTPAYNIQHTKAYLRATEHVILLKVGMREKRLAYDERLGKTCDITPLNRGPRFSCTFIDGDFFFHYRNRFELKGLRIL